MTTRLDGKVALISGVSDGIGGCIAQCFAREGASVVCSGIQMDIVAAIVADIRTQGGQALALELDVTVADHWGAAVQKTIASFGGFDVLVNNAGLNPTAPISPDNFQFPAGLEAVRAAAERNFEPGYVTGAMVEEELRRLSQPGALESYQHMLRYVTDPGVRAEWGLATRLPEVGISTLVVWGADDPIIKVEYGHQAVELLPNGRLALVENGEHIPFAKKPQRFSEAVREFLG